jgi:putative intracellular protease/amidase
MIDNAAAAYCVHPTLLHFNDKKSAAAGADGIGVRRLRREERHGERLVGDGDRARMLDIRSLSAEAEMSGFVGVRRHRDGALVAYLGQRSIRDGERFRLAVECADAKEPCHVESILHWTLRSFKTCASLRAMLQAEASSMKRKDLLGGAIAGAAAAALTGPARASDAVSDRGKPLTLPASKRIKIACAIAPGATLIDFAGPWEVFGEVMVYSLGTTMNEQMPFDQYLVAKSSDPVATESGMQIVPAFTFTSAPQPDVLIVGAQPRSRELTAYIQQASRGAAVTASVCTGAFRVAEAGLFDGLPATTHHAFYDEFEREFPQVQLVRDVRYVENPTVASAGGLTSGIDLALRIVERYFGSQIATDTAHYLEYKRSTIATYWPQTTAM